MSKKTHLMENDETYRKVAEMSASEERKLIKTEKPKLKVLIVPDVAGWILETFADNIIKVLKDKYDFTKIIAEDGPKSKYLDYLSNHESEFDIIYILLPGYLPNKINDKYLTTFHGGPGVEGQADQIDRQDMNDMGISFVSYQVKDRVINEKWHSNRRFNAPLTLGGTIDYVKLCKEQNLIRKQITKLKVEPLAVPRIAVNLHIEKRGFDLTNLQFTACGVNPSEYKRTQDMNQSKLICGYAGWLRYIKGGQADHRRTDWIIQAQNKFNFDLELAAGLEKYVGKEVENYRRGLKLNRVFKINVNCYDKNEMSDFYSKINCYLVPDLRAGGPMPVLEAGLLEVPPVTTDCGLCGDIITHMENGYLVSSQKEFENGIAFMRDNPEERIRMGKNLRKYILENRTWEKVAGHWENFFNSVEKKFIDKHMR